MAGRSVSDVGSGGMATKIAAARIAVRCGLPHVHRLRPSAPSRSDRIEAGARCTWFMPSADAASPRASSGSRARCEPAGAVHIDAGALHALRSGKSLLAAGVTGTRGRFEVGRHGQHA